ncbi:MAG: M56 family metallopeptidase [Sphingobium sp.]|nr:M56 family metallopeptidase [Sphingobium sp.]
MTATLLMLALKSLVIAAIALAGLRLTRKRSAAERSTIAHLGLFALVALPLASLFLPALSVSLPEALSAPIVYDEPAAPEAVPAPLPLAPETTQAPDIVNETVTPLVQSPSIAERVASLARYAYALPALALLLLTGIALLRLVALRARAQVLVDPHWVGALARAQHRMGFKNGTALLTSTELHSPISWGLLRPTILVNESALDSGGQAEAVLAHELAHVIHGDWAKLMLSRVATAAFWFNPLAWVLAREAHQLREEAADDAVLAANIAGTDYAELLVGVARHENRGLLLGAHGVAPARNSLRRRVARVLDKTPARGPSGASWVAGFTAGMLVMAAPLAAVTFGPARHKADPAVSPIAKAAEPAKSWSTRAGEGPNQLLSEPARPAKSHSAALASAVRGLHGDDWPMDAHSDANADVDYDDAMVPGSPEWNAYWAKYGAAMGARYGRAFANAAPVAQPMPKASRAVPQHFNFDFSGLANFNPGKKYSERELDAMIGVTDDYRKEIADAGFANATRNELLAARSLGVSGEYIADMRKAGINVPLATYAQARGQGISSNFIEGMRDAGLSGSLNDYIKARNMGVTGAYVSSLKEAGIKGTLDDYARARSLGISAGYVSALAGVGVTGSIEEYQQMRAVGITSSYVAALHRNGTMITEPRRLIEIKTKGWRDRDRNDDP